MDIKQANTLKGINICSFYTDDYNVLAKGSMKNAFLIYLSMYCNFNMVLFKWNWGWKKETYGHRDIKGIFEG